MVNRTVYIVSFTFLGFLLASLLHGLIEIPVINLLTSDFERYGLGLTWDNWFTIHAVGGSLLWIGGLIFGYKQGVHWYDVIYVKGNGKRK